MEELSHSLSRSVIDTLFMKNNFPSINISQNIYILFTIRTIVIILDWKKKKI